MINPHKAVEWMRKKYPDTMYLSKDEVYEMAKKQFPNEEFPDNPFLPDYSKEEIPHTEKNIEEYDVSPEKVNQTWYKWNAADYFTEEGIPFWT